MTTPTPLSMPGANAGMAAVQPVGQPAAAPPVPAPSGTPQPVQTIAPAAPAAPAAAAEPAPAAPATPAAPAVPAAPQAPPWGDDANFDPQRAWNLINNLRNDLADYKQKADPVLQQAEEQRRAAQGELATVREDLTNLTAQLDTWRGEAVRASAEALAGNRFIDADAALALVGDLSQFATPNGVDTQKLTSRFEQLAADKPHLVAATQQQPRGFAPNRGQGTSSGGPLTSAQIANNAASQGDWRGSLAAKAQMLSDMPRT